MSKIEIRHETNLPFQNVARQKKIHHLEAKLEAISNVYKWMNSNLPSLDGRHRLSAISGGLGDSKISVLHLMSPLIYSSQHKSF